MSFANVAKYKVDKSTRREYRFHNIDLGNGKIPSFIVVSASDVNKSYFSAFLKATSPKMRQAQSSKITMNFVEEVRAINKDLYSKYVIVGWKNVIDDEGRESQFSPTQCREFLNYLPDQMFDELTSFCSTYTNFIDDFPAADEMEQIAGNS